MPIVRSFFAVQGRLWATFYDSMNTDVPSNTSKLKASFKAVANMVQYAQNKKTTIFQLYFQRPRMIAADNKETWECCL